VQLSRLISGSRNSAERSAETLLATLSLLLRFVRRHMRARRGEGLAVVQLRALIFVNQNWDAILSELAQHIGLSLPAACRMVAGLVRRDMMARRSHPDDLRRVVLRLTPHGRAVFNRAYRGMRRAVAGCLGELSDVQLCDLDTVMETLQHLFDRPVVTRTPPHPRSNRANGTRQKRTPKPVKRHLSRVRADKRCM
jgi:DNA-binding MarR family transcriptional regulator